MLFSTWSFVVFLAVVFAVYYLSTKTRWQVTILTVASYVFYGWSNPWLIVLLLGSTWLNAYAVLALLKEGQSDGQRKRLVFAIVALNLLLLGLFKYAALLASTFLPKELWEAWGPSITAIPLPIGISFFTFQGISLVVDVYRSGAEGIEGIMRPRTPGEKASLTGRMLLYNAFFPSLIAGPIVKAHEFMYQIASKAFRDIDWEDVFVKLSLGFFLKMVVADNLKEITAPVPHLVLERVASLDLILLVYAFSFQIFADFCGYSLIAMGLARMFGYQLPINFCFPYLSASVTEFWRRWHISLSTWLKQYLYIPLGGNRKGPGRTYVNLFLVMLLGGLWHGAEWSYLFWGGAHGVILALERLWGVTGSAPKPGGSWAGRLVATLRILLIFNIVSLLWLFFMLPDFNHVMAYLKAIAALRPGVQPQWLFVTAFFSLPVVLYHLYGLLRESTASAANRLNMPQALWSPKARMAFVALLLFFIICNSGSPGVFIYFQF